MRPCGCNVSTGICGCITRGHGRLDENGYWQIQCPHGFAFEEYEGPCSIHSAKEVVPDERT